MIPAVHDESIQRGRLVHAFLQDIVDEIVLKFRVNKIILFGSHARGEAIEDSDVDLLVLMDFEGSAVRQSARIRSVLERCSLPLDVIVRRPEEFTQRCAMNDWFMREIRDRGKILYAA
jgi:predicted nucleotidyltransferase